MKKKLFFLLIGCMLVASGLYAQSSEYIVEDEEEVVITVQPQDTVVEAVKPIPVTQRTWETLEKDLKDQVVTLSKGYTNKKVTKEDVVWIYEIRNVPTTTGDSFLGVADEAMKNKVNCDIGIRIIGETKELF